MKDYFAVFVDEFAVLIKQHASVVVLSIGDFWNGATDQPNTIVTSSVGEHIECGPVRDLLGIFSKILGTIWRVKTFLFDYKMNREQD